jgi:hypothetical protein
MSESGGISFVQLVEYTRIGLEEKINDSQRDFDAYRAEVGATIQDMRRDGRQLVERQYKYERMIDTRMRDHVKAIDDRIGNIERIMERVERFARWMIYTLIGSVFVAVSTAVALKALGI